VLGLAVPAKRRNGGCDGSLAEDVNEEAADELAVASVMVV